MLDVSFPLRVLAFASFVLGLVGSLLSMAAVLWFGIVYSSSTEYGYFWFVVLILYLIPSAFGMLATQLSMYLYPTLLTYSGMEVAFNTTKSCWWCCVCCFPYHDTVTRAFTNLAMITAAIGLVQVSWQSLFTYRTFDETAEMVQVLMSLFYFSLGSTCLSCFITATFLLQLKNTDRPKESKHQYTEYVPLMDYGSFEQFSREIR